MGSFLGGGDRGAFLDVACVPCSSAASTITDLLAAGTSPAGYLVTLTFGDGYEVDLADANDVPDGKILAYEKVGSSYRLLVRLWSYIDLNGERHTPVGIANLPYSGTAPSLGESILAYANDGKTVKKGTSTGWGAVIEVDTPTSGYCDVLF